MRRQSVQSGRSPNAQCDRHEPPNPVAKVSAEAVVGLGGRTHATTASYALHMSADRITYCLERVSSYRDFERLCSGLLAGAPTIHSAGLFSALMPSSPVYLTKALNSCMRAVNPSCA